MVAKRKTKEKKIDESQKRIEELEEQVKRSLADYQNLEKRVREERISWIKTSNQDLILRLLPTLDHLHTALKGAKESGENSAWIQGIEMAVREFRKVLEEEGLEYVQTETFDPNLHEVVEVRNGPNGSILDILQMGYTLNGKLIRPAKVVVGKEGN